MACTCTLPIIEETPCPPFQRPTAIVFDVKTATIADVLSVSIFCRGEIDRLKVLSEEELGAGNDAEFTDIENQKSKFYALWMICEDEIERRISNYLR